MSSSQQPDVLDRARFSADREAEAEIRGDPELGRIVADAQQRSGALPTRRRMLAAAVRIHPRPAPELSKAIGEVAERSRVTAPFETYVYCDASINAAVLPGKDKNLLIVSSAAVFERVQQVAAIAGYKVGPHPEQDLLVAGFDMGNGRSQMVYIAHVGQTGDGKDVISFMSPCMTVKRGLFGGLSKRRAVHLLRLNSQMLFGCFALYTFQNEDVLMVSSSQIVDTMEVEEFSSHLQACAQLADAYEQKVGQDNF